MNYWLLKSEPNTYSIDDMKIEKQAYWEGVRNYQARNFMRDKMKKGDIAFFYHSNAKPSGIVGVVKIVKESYPDHTAFDKKSVYYDKRSTKENPVWCMVDVQFVKKYNQIISLSYLKEIKGLEKMILLQKGSRLSVQPVSAKEFEIVEQLAV